MIPLYVLAQAAVAAVSPADPAGASAAQPAVTSYPPAFFAAQNPSSALDMVGRLPGFSFDRGDSVRGFEGAAGNVLVDGQRPSSKSDGLESILQRIPSGKVERIDVIRGGARKVVVILNAVPQIDSSGISTLVRISIQLAREGGTLRLVCGPGRVRDALTVTRLIEAIPAFETESAALANFA